MPRKHLDFLPLRLGSLGNKIRVEQKRRGISITAVGAEMGVPRMAIWRWVVSDVKPQHAKTPLIEAWLAHSRRNWKRKSQTS